MSGRTGQPATLAEALPRIRAVLLELAQEAGRRDQEFEHPYALIQDLADAGFGRLRVPVEHGGFDVDLPTLVQILAEAAQADSNVPQIWRGHFTTTEILRLEGDPAVRERWFAAVADGAVFGNAQSEPSAVSAPAHGSAPTGLAATTTTVRTDADGRRRISGRKFYSTGARFADYIRAAVLDDGVPAFVVIPARHPGVEHVDDWDGLGQRQTGSGTTILTDVPVEPDGNVGRFRESMRGLDSFVQLVHLANLAGIARSVVEETVAVLRTRTRTSGHAADPAAPATHDPDLLAVIGLLQARRQTAEALAQHAASVLESAHARGDESDYVAAYIETSTAQIAVIEAVLDATARLYDALGSSAVRNRTHLDRHWRNARTLASHNPVVYKHRVVGDYLVNGRGPVSGYYRGRPSNRDAAIDEGALTS